MVATLLTLYGGLIFVQEDGGLTILTIIYFFVIVIANLRFIILWVFCMTTVFKKKRYAHLAGEYIKRIF